MKKVFEINGDGGLFCKVMRKVGDNNPYRIYDVWWGRDAQGRIQRHQKLIVKYADFYSVLCYLKDRCGL